MFYRDTLWGRHGGSAKQHFSFLWRGSASVSTVTIGDRSAELHCPNAAVSTSGFNMYTASWHSLDKVRAAALSEHWIVHLRWMFCHLVLMFSSWWTCRCVLSELLRAVCRMPGISNRVWQRLYWWPIKHLLSLHCRRPDSITELCQR